MRLEWGLRYTYEDLKLRKMSIQPEFARSLRYTYEDLKLSYLRIIRSLN